MEGTMVLDTFTVNGHTVEIHSDIDADNPHTEGIPGCKLVLHGGRNYTFPNDAGIDFGAHEGWSAVADELAKRHGALLVTPVWVYDHSGIGLKAGTRVPPFDDIWDSAQVGFAYITQETYQACTGKRYTGHPSQYAKATRMIAAEVETYGQWVNGEVYWYIVTDADGNEVDSCGGFIGWDNAKAAATEAAERA